MPVNRSAIILVHGRGGSPGDFSAFQLQLRQHIDLFPIRYLTPDAPRYPFEDDGVKDNNALSLFKAGVEELNQEIQAQIDRGIPASQIALVGFAQGANLILGAVAAPNLLKVKIAGCFVVAGYCPLVIQEYLNSIQENISSEEKVSDIPVVHFHGTKDPVVPLEKAIAAKEYFEGKLGFTNYKLVEIEDGKHTLSPKVNTLLIDELPGLFGSQ